MRDVLVVIGLSLDHRPESDHTVTPLLDQRLGGVDQVGPTAGTTREVALCALGWAIKLAAESSEDARVLTLRIPAPFVEAVDAALEAGCRVEATLMIYARNLNLAFDRSTFGHIALP